MTLKVKDVAWAAGFLDGEGCFGFRTNMCFISVAQKDPWPLTKLQGMVGGKIYNVKGACDRWYFALHITGRKAVGVMLTVYSYLSPRRQQKISESIARWKAQRLKTDLKNTTHCRHGHLYTPETTYFHPTKHKRECRVCVSASQAKYQKKLRLKLVS